MKVEQIYELTNKAVKQAIGETAVLEEDLSNIVDIGEKVFDSGAMDNYVKSLVNHIGKVEFMTRVYKGEVPSVLMDGWEFGSVLQRVRFGLPEAKENDSWDLQDGKSYDPNIFNKPEVSARFFNSKTTFEVDISVTEMQVKESFSSAQQLAGFISGLETTVQNVLTVRFDELIKRTINSMTADTMFDEFGATGPVAGESGVKAVNLLALYQQEVDETLTDPKEALIDLEFLKFASAKIGKRINDMRSMSKLFNIGKNERFTPTDKLKVIMLNEFKENAGYYLQSEVFNNEFTELPDSETINYWQGSGTTFDFESTSKVHTISGSGNKLETDGILAVMFDRDALGVTNQDRRVTSHFNPRAEFYNNFYKADASYFTDLDENFVVFYVK